MLKNLGSCALGCLVLAACSNSSTKITEGNASLGIAKFQITEGAQVMTIIGLDTQANEVARLELTHGRYVPTDDLGQQPGEAVDGRRLTVKVKDQTFEWQTMGYTDTTHMPSLVSQHRDLVAAFTADVHVQPLLHKWSIGWAGPELGGEVAYDQTGCVGGTSAPSGCGATCALQDGETTPACNGNPVAAVYIVDTSSVQSEVVQCCGTSYSGNLTMKTCTTIHVCVGGSQAGQACTTNANCPSSTCDTGHYTSACGSSANKCMPCGSPISYTGSCSLSTSGNSICYDYCNEAGTSCDEDADCCGGGACCDGTCTNEITCDVCTPSCAGKDCGDDGCEGSCGSCSGVDTCGGGGTAGVCGCTPQCTGKDCGDDGCDGSCGSCSGYDSCGGGGTAGVCGCTAATCGSSCGTISDGCGHDLDCGGCSSGYDCVNNSCTPSCSHDCYGSCDTYNGCGELCGCDTGACCDNVCTTEIFCD